MIARLLDIPHPPCAESANPIKDSELKKRSVGNSLRYVFGLSQHLFYVVLFTIFQTACGYEYTHKLHRMFTDMNISADLNSKFSKYLESSSQQFKINFSLLVLQVSK